MAMVSVPMNLSNSQQVAEPRWAFNLDGRTVEIPEIGMVVIRAKLTPMMQWIRAKITFVMEVSVKLSFLPHMEQRVQVLKPTLVSDNHVVVRELNLGVLELLLSLHLGTGRAKKMMAWMGWSFRREAESLLPLVDCSSHFHQ